eukprot:s1807_g10.t1
MREYMRIPRSATGQIQDEVVKPGCRNYVDLASHPEEKVPQQDSSMCNAARDESGSAGAVSQPEGETFPSQAPSSVSPCPSLADDPGEIPGPNGIDFDAPVETPIPEESGDVLFGDDLDPDVGEEGFWEIGLDWGPQKDIEEIMLCESPGDLEWSLLATGARKQRVEVQWKTLTESERQLFFKATAN